MLAGKSLWLRRDAVATFVAADPEPHAEIAHVRQVNLAPRAILRFTVPAVGPHFSSSRRYGAKLESLKAMPISPRA